MATPLSSMKRRDLRRQLIDAIVAIDLPRAREIATVDPSIVNSATSHQNVPLGDAIDTGSSDLVKLLIELGADPHHCNHGGHSLLDGAAFSGHIGIARYFISLGLEPTVHHAAAVGDIPLLERMLATDFALLESTSAGGRWRMTPLHAAVLAGNLEAVEYLLSIDAPVDAINHNGHTALALITGSSLREAQLSIAKLLLSRGADVNSQAGHHGGTVLHRSIMDGDHSLAQLLLENGADPNRQDWSGKTPLHHAVTKNRKLVELVLKYSPNLDTKSRAGETAMQLTMRLKKHAIFRMLERES